MDSLNALKVEVEIVGSFKKGAIEDCQQGEAWTHPPIGGQYDWDIRHLHPHSSERQRGIEEASRQSRDWNFRNRKATVIPP